VSYSWVRKGQRKRVPYENPEGRRVNALAALVKGGATPALYWVAKPGSLRSEHLVAARTELPPAPVPTVVVLDNGSIHRSKATRAAIPALWARGVYLDFLPPYSPELNAIEPVFGAVKHYYMPERRYASVPTLRHAVTAAFTTYEEDLITKHVHHPRRAA
jgi:putative transposase